MPPKLFRFTHFTKNASVTPLDSHTFKTKDLKPFRFTHFQKKGGGRGPGPGLRAIDARTGIGARRERRGSLFALLYLNNLLCLLSLTTLLTIARRLA